MTDHANTPDTTVTRRGLLAGAGALVIGFSLPLSGRRGALAAADDGPVWKTSDEAAQINAWLRIGPDGSVTVVTGRSEMGQGPTTALPQALAEELGVPMDRVTFAMSPVDPAYNNTLFGAMITGGSTSVKSDFEQMRRAGASAREMLKAAAAEKWGVDAAELKVENGTISHAHHSATFGELAGAAAEMEAPKDVALKKPADWTLIGTDVKRLDTHAKATGQATFGIDVVVPDMLHAAILQAPTFGATLESVDAKPATDMKGVAQVVELDDAIMVLADTWWTADQALSKLSPKWTGGAEDLDDAKVDRVLTEGLDAAEAAQAVSEGDADGALSGAAKTVEATYSAPYLAHLTMEPMTATADVRADKAELWLPTQAQTWTAGAVAKAVGLKPEQVTIHTTFLGGGFGRRAEQDFALQAAQASKAAGRPVKLVWSRPQDVRHDFYRPASKVRFTVGLDEDGLPMAWKARVCCPSIAQRMLPSMIKEGVDPFAVEGLTERAYALPADRSITYVMPELAVPVGFWRSVGHSQNGFFMEAMIDELADAAGMDPLEYRRKLLPQDSRHRRVLDAAADAIGWSEAPAEGRHRGIAVHESFGSIAAEAIEVSVDGDNKVTLHRASACVDCAVAVNPNIIRQQMESALVYGLTAAMFGGVSLKNGQVQEGNFDRIDVMRLRHMPPVEVRIIAEGDAEMGGIGEPGTPPAAPALVAALRRATGKPIRSLPLTAEGFTFG
ncbi:Isoquinoline 1-oxidoreductase beta subunit [Caenispirillum salinarum AK4]|uniref:Isoquinoline 1-oxidoreductase beta subunit n=1 Tax=Caenispirillum salinarum AK4 TaxID=1238182 RepID=K9H0I6_9PROT|nr:molybdopterin cofactor-binding domain-containing protein [Caenispirillum salinarum]EKV31750.1 Isoquinoline 1-oxidoreductase beta subunit [Caenispirillum salinarum AK4]